MPYYHSRVMLLYWGHAVTVPIDFAHCEMYCQCRQRQKDNTLKILMTFRTMYADALVLSMSEI
jgi:hypothetical protein